MLVVDDEPAIRTLCRVNLQFSGFDVAEAGNGRDALALIDREAPDLVLLDVMMPELDGWQVAQRLLSDESSRDIPIVFLSARAAHEDRVRGFAAGAVGYIVKPFDPTSLGGILEQMLQRLALGERDALRREMMEQG